MKLRTRQITNEQFSTIPPEAFTNVCHTDSTGNIVILGEAWLNTYSQYCGLNHDDTDQALNYLELKINALQKNLNYLDVLHVIGAIEDLDNAKAQINSLTNNTALIVNISNFEYGTDTYSLGDVIVRDYNGNLIHIHNESTGYYYPSKISTDSTTGNTVLTYSYAQQDPATGDHDVPTDSLLQKAYHQLNVPITIPTGNTIYGDCNILQTSNNTITKESSGIKPIVYYYYTVDGETRERIVFADADYTYDDDPSVTDLTLVNCPSALANKILYVVK